MKLRATNKVLGLAMGERSTLVAEVTVVDGRARITRAGEFTHTGAAALQQPEALGAALGAFLKQEGFTARAAVFGIPAKWVLSKAKEVPPVDPSLAADLLRMQVEADFPPELTDLVYDYAGESSAGEPRTVLLLATPRRHVEQALAIAEAAKLDALAIAPTAAVLSAATVRSSGDAMVVSITPSGTELAAQQGAGPAILRYVGAAAASAPAVAGEVRRAVLTMPRTSGTVAGNGATNGHAHGAIIVWDDVGLNDEARRAVTDAMGLGARSGDLSALGLSAGDQQPGTRGFAAAAALAMGAINAGTLPVDFLHPRLAEPKRARIHRNTLLAIAAGVVLVAGTVFGYVDLHNKERDLAAAKEQVKRVEKPRKAAQAQVDMIEYAQGWHAGKPRYVACLRDLTRAVVSLPEESQIYMTSFNLHDNMKGVISGKATSDRTVLALLDRLKATKRFSDIKPALDTREARTGREVSFQMTFKYAGASDE